MSELSADTATAVDRSALARAAIAAILTVIAVGTLVLVFILAPVPALAGLLTAGSGLRKRNPYRTLNRVLFVVCALVVASAVLLSLLLFTAGGSVGTSVSTPVVVSH